MYTGEVTTLERAYELARTGQFKNLTEIKRRLKAERFPDIDEALFGLGIRRQIIALCVQSGGRPPRPTR